MTFLNPFVLFGLAAAAIPILLHLLNKRKLRTIEFSTLSFLKELQKSTMRRITIRQWLLLLLRTLFIILIVLAFSRPVLQGSFAGFGTHAKTTMVLIVDDSYSMGIENRQGAFIRQARDAALRVLGMMKEEDEVALIRLSDVPEASFAPARDPAAIRAALQALSLSPKHRTVEDAVRLAARILDASKNFNKEIYIITDAQRSTFVNDAITDIRDAGERLFDARTKFYILPLNDRPFENCGVERVSRQSPLLQPGKSAAVEVVIKNYGGTAVSNRLASLIVNGSRVMQKTLSIPPGSSAPAEFSFVPSAPGFQRCTVELEDDVLEADNRYYFTLYVPEQIRIVLASDDETQTPYLRAALAAIASSGGTESEPFLSVTDALPGRLSSSALNDADLVLACGVREFGRTDGQMIAMAMQNGTGLLLFPGSHMDAARMNAEFLPALGLPTIQTTGAPDGAAGQTSFDRIDFDHPVMKGIFELSGTKRQPQVESPQIFMQARFEPQQPLRPIITTGTGAYFLWEKKFGRGTILGFSVPPTIGWSDFVLKPIFIPLLSQAILYIGSSVNAGVQPGVVGREVDPGTILIPRAARRVNASVPLKLYDPRGNETKFAASVLDSKGAFVLAASLGESAQETGFYAIMQERDTVTVAGMNIDPAESDGKPITAAEITSAIERYGGTASVMNPGTSIDTAVLESRFGVELWKYFLIVALVVAVIEMLVARESRDAGR